MLLDLIKELFSVSSTGIADALANQLLTGQGSVVADYPFAAFLVVTIFCFLFGAVGALVYALTRRDEPVSWNFLLTLTMIPAAISILVLLVNDNLGRAIGLGGIFTLVRFRSVPGDPKDLACIVFAMTCGVAGGLRLLAYAAATMGFFVIFMVVAYLLSSAQGRSRSRCKLKITVPENMCWDKTFDAILQKYTKRCVLARVKTVELGSFFELAYDITLKPNVNEKEMIDEIRTVNGNLTVLLNKKPDAAYTA